MADRAADPAAGDADEPGQRGQLRIADRVVQRVATIAAGEVDGVVSIGSGLDQVLGHRYPKADATVAGSRTRIEVDVAVAWPHPLARVSADVRQNVRQRVSDLVGLQVDAVDVTASKIVHQAPEDNRRVQ